MKGKVNARDRKGIGTPNPEVLRSSEEIVLTKKFTWDLNRNLSESRRGKGGLWIGFCRDYLGFLSFRKSSIKEKGRQIPLSSVSKSSTQEIYVRDLVIVVIVDPWMLFPFNNARGI